MLMVMLALLWLGCLAAYVHQAEHGGIVWPGILVTAAETADGLPVVVGFWPGMGAEASGLLPGDQIVHVETEFLSGVGPVGFFARALEARGVGRSVSIGYMRGIAAGETELPLAPLPVPWWVFVVVPATFAVLAVVVALRATLAGEARSVFLAYAAISFFFLPWPGGLRGQTYAWLIVTAISSLVVLPLSIRSFLLFPEEVAPRSRWVRQAPWLFAVMPVFIGSWWFGLPLSHNVGFRLTMALSAAFVAVMVSVSLLNYRRGSPVARRKMRWRLYGTCLGMTPVAATVSLGLLFPHLEQVVAFIFTSCVGLVVVPISLTIAIVRYNVLDIDRLISVTASYSILAFLALAGALALIPRITEALSGAIGIERSIGQISLSLVLAALVVPAHRRLRPQIDRIFFAQRYAMERGMERLLAELSACADRQAVLLLAAGRLDALLQPVSAVLYTRAGNAYEPIFQRGLRPPSGIEMSGPLVAALEQLERPLGTDSGTTTWMGGRLSPFDRAALETLAASVIVPVRCGSELAAFLSVGPKRSGDVYTGTDFSWLRAVADKLAGELLRLEYAQRIEAEHARQESLRRYVPGAVAKELDSGTELETSERDVSVLFVDLRGYTAYAEERRVEEVFSVVNRYTEIVTDLVCRHGGSVVEFAGDGMMAVFGAPQALANKERAALDAGYDMLRAVASVAESGGALLQVGVGIATGPAFVGNVRGSDRLIWTVIGNTPNLAARLQTLTRDLKVEMAIDAATWNAGGAAAAAFQCRPRTPIRGRSEPQDVYVLTFCPHARMSPA